MSDSPRQQPPSLEPPPIVGSLREQLEARPRRAGFLIGGALLSLTVAAGAAVFLIRADGGQMPLARAPEAHEQAAGAIANSSSRLPMDSPPAPPVVAAEPRAEADKALESTNLASAIEATEKSRSPAHRTKGARPLSQSRPSRPKSGSRRHRSHDSSTVRASERTAPQALDGLGPAKSPEPPPSVLPSDAAPSVGTSARPAPRASDDAPVPPAAPMVQPEGTGPSATEGDSLPPLPEFPIPPPDPEDPPAR